MSFCRLLNVFQTSFHTEYLLTKNVQEVLVHDLGVQLAPVLVVLLGLDPEVQLETGQPIVR